MLSFNFGLFGSEEPKYKEQKLLTYQLAYLFKKYEVALPKKSYEYIEKESKYTSNILKTSSYQVLKERILNESDSSSKDLFLDLIAYFDELEDKYDVTNIDNIKSIIDLDIETILKNSSLYESKIDDRAINFRKKIIGDLLDIKELDTVFSREVITGKVIYNNEEVDLKQKIEELQEMSYSKVIDRVNEYLGIEVIKDSPYNYPSRFINTVIPYSIFHTGTFEYVDSVWKMILDEYNKVEDKLIAIVEPKVLYNLIDSKYREMTVTVNMLDGIIKIPYDLGPGIVQPIIIILNKKKTNDDVRFLDLSTLIKDENSRRFVKENNIKDVYENDKNVVIVNRNDLNERHYDFSVEKIIARSKYQNFDSVPLSKLTKDIYRGYPVKIKNNNEEIFLDKNQKMCKVIGLSNVESGVLNIDTLEEIPYEESYEKCLVQNNDIIVSAKFTTFKSTLVKLKSNELVIASGNLYIIRPDKNQIIPEYLKAFIDSPVGSELIDSLSKGNALKMIKSCDLKDMPIPLIDIDVQKEIANELNEALNEMAIAQEKLKEAQTRYLGAFDKYYSK